MEEKRWCVKCQSITKWVRTVQTSQLTGRKQFQFQCSKCKEVESSGNKRGRPTGW